MSYARHTVALAGIAVGLVHTSQITNAENEPSKSWLRWLVHTSPGHDRNTGAQLDAVKQLERKPGQVVAWGGAFGKKPRVIEGVGNRIVKAAAGNGCGIAMDQDGVVYGFSSGDDGDTVHQIPTQRPITDVAVIDSARQLVMVDASGRVLQSTVNAEGSFEPAKALEGCISRARITRVDCGQEHCVALTHGGDAYSWGSSNSHGQLGTGSIEASASIPDNPRQVQLPNGVLVQDVACGNKHTMFVDKRGTLFGVGDDHWAQLGISAEPWLSTHEQKSGVLRKSELVRDLAVQEVAGGGSHSVMLVRDGTVFSFGFNQWGQLGHHNYSSLAPPSPIADVRIRAAAVSAGANHTCIVKDNGEMCCIGGNEEGQLGTGNLQPAMVWKKVRLGKKAINPSYVNLSGNTSIAVVPVESAVS